MSVMPSTGSVQENVVKNHQITQIAHQMCNPPHPYYVNFFGLLTCEELCGDFTVHWKVIVSFNQITASKLILKLYFEIRTCFTP